ncbi:MAG: hypothetical protein HPY45_12740 [Anaerolineae bacterium]|nr:hypothetical protein [Anaerolineae bacterium]
MSEDHPFQDGNLGEELHNLGKNIGALLRSAWQSPERQKLQEDIESGLADLVATLNSAAEEFRQSETGKQVQAEIEDIKQRLQNGELENKIRNDLYTILRQINAELEKGIDKHSE